MSPISLKRFAVVFNDYGEYRIIVEAVSAELALKKAKRAYFINGLGDDSIEPMSTMARGWKVQPLVAEV